MSAELLREAEALMRERAEAATNGPWLIDSIETGEHALFLPDGRSPEQERLGCGGSQIAGWMTEFNATHIASWHPDVVLALADLLGEVARWVEMTPPNPPGEGLRGLTVSESAWAAMYPLVLTFARTYLGRGA